MNLGDPNLHALELAVLALGPLREELVLVGGCTVGLLITDTARPPVRETLDVDLVAEVATAVEYYALSARLRAIGFKEQPQARNMCRWQQGRLMLDVMPSEPSVLGHSANRWFPQAVRHSQRMQLRGGVFVNVVSPPIFLATKLEAFHDRGNGDYGHHDMEDIVNVIDGRVELIGEVAQAPVDVRDFLREEFDDLVSDAAFVDRIPMHLRPDYASQARTPIIIDRLRQLAGL